MGKEYSLDLRERVIAFLEQGNDTQTASELFQISQRTVQRWRKRKLEKGNVRPLRREFAYKKIDYERLKAYLEQHPDQFLYEIAEEFSVTLQAIFYACKKIKFTRKKRQLSIKREKLK